MSMLHKRTSFQRNNGALLHAVFTRKRSRVLTLSCGHSCLILIRHKFEAAFVATSENTTLSDFFMNINKKTTTFESIEF